MDDLKITAAKRFIVLMASFVSQFDYSRFLAELCLRGGGNNILWILKKEKDKMKLIVSPLDRIFVRYTAPPHDLSHNCGTLMTHCDDTADVSSIT